MINEVDLKVLWKELDAYSKELDTESKTLEEIWCKIAELDKKIEVETKEILVKPEFQFLEASHHIGLNIGGQFFRTNVAELTRDPYSVLAACCRLEPVIQTQDDGTFYFDRDWWLFRHILAFLRSNILPNEIETLKELYTEASFWRLESLQKAIENIPLEELSNLTPQIMVTWPGLMDRTYNHLFNENETNMNGKMINGTRIDPLKRPKDSYVLDSSLFKSLSHNTSS